MPTSYGLVNNEYRAFYFFHVRIGTLVFGIWQSLSQFAAMILVLSLIVNPHLFTNPQRVLQWESVLSFLTLGQNDAFLTDHKPSSTYRHSEANMKNPSGDFIDNWLPKKQMSQIQTDGSSPINIDQRAVSSIWERAQGEELKRNIFDKLMQANKINNAKGSADMSSGEDSPVITLDNQTESIEAITILDTSSFHRRHSRLSDRLVSFAVISFSLGFTLLLVVGTFRGRPSYLMPYFCLQVFDLVITCITVVGYFSYLPDMKHWIRNQEALPYRDELLRLNEMALSLLLMGLGATLIVVKFYLLTMVWSCYKFLVRRYNGSEIESGFCMYRPPALKSILQYIRNRGQRSPGDRSTAVQSQLTLQPIPVPISCCGLFANELACAEYRAMLENNEDDPSTNQPLLSSQNEADVEATVLPKYEDLLLTPANANMPPPYFK